MEKPITYRRLREMLKSLGYSPENVLTDQVAFRNPDHHLFILLPRRKPQARVRPLDLLRVRNVLVNDGIIPQGGFDSLFEIKNRTGSSRRGKRGQP